jgi:hypothetical protein
LIKEEHCVKGNLCLVQGDASDRSAPAALDDRQPNPTQYASGIHEELKRGPAEERAISELSPDPMVFIKEFTYSAQPTPLPLAEISCCPYWVSNETEQKSYVDPVPLGVLPPWDSCGGCFDKDRSKERRPQDAPMLFAKNDLNGLNIVKSDSSSWRGHCPRRRRSCEVRAFPHVVGCKDIEHNLARPLICRRHVAMAYTVGVDPFEFEAAGFQPSTQAYDCALVDTDVNNHVDVLGHADWFDATLKSEQPYHLTANKAPASRKFYVELEQDLPGFLLSWRHRFQHYRVHKIS